MVDVHFPIYLDEPPDLVLAHVARRASSHQVMYFNVAHWGLDFYHNGGTIEFRDTGRIVTFHPGDIGITPPRSRLKVIDEEDREEIYFSFDTRQDRGGMILLPAVISTGEKFAALQEMALEAVRSWPVRPARSRSLVWALLWEIARCHEINNPDQASLHPVVRRSVEIMEMEMSGDVRIHDLAERVGVAAATLSRLFREAVGSTAIAYLRSRRIERAKVLFANTDMAIKEVAYRVGLPDLHQFNKTFRRETGVCPRRFRESASSPDGVLKNLPTR